jgi:hypothetical protein
MWLLQVLQVQHRVSAVLPYTATPVVALELHIAQQVKAITLCRQQHNAKQRHRSQHVAEEHQHVHTVLYHGKNSIVVVATQCLDCANQHQ